jgi:hypothetical protein
MSLILETTLLRIMSGDISTGFKSVSERVVQFHSYVIALLSGVVIGFFTNYLITYIFHLPNWLGIGLSLSFLGLSLYLFLLYSPEASGGFAEEIVPKSLHEFFNNNFDKLLGYIKFDWEGYAFHGNLLTFRGWTKPISGVKVEINKIGSHQAKIILTFPLLKYIKCKFRLKLFISTLTEIPEDRTVNVNIRMNIFARLHPKSDIILHTLGIRLRHVLFNPQIVDPKISDKDYYKILKEIKPSVWEVYGNKPNKE